MRLPRLPRENRGTWLVAIALAVVAVVVAGVAVHELSKPKTSDSYNPKAAFVTTPKTTKITKKQAKTFIWPLYGLNDARTRDFVGPSDLKPPFTVKWKLGGNAPLEFPPDIDGNVMFFLDDNATLNKVNATTGVRYWRERIGTWSAATPVLDPKAHLLFIGVLSKTMQAPGNGQFVAVSTKNGQIKWKDPIASGTESSPLLWHNTVYFGDAGGTMHAVSAMTGAQKWAFPTGGAVKGGPTLANGILYFGNYSGDLYAVNATTGKQVWERSITPNIYASPTLANGRVYVGTTSGGFYSLLQSNGTVAWSFNTGNYVYSSAAVDENVPGKGPTVFFGSYNGTAYAVNAKSGAVEWTADFGDSISGAASIVNNVVYFSGVHAPTFTKGYDVSTGKQVYYYPDGGYTATVASPRAVYLMGQYVLYELLPKKK